MPFVSAAVMVAGAAASAAAAKKQGDAVQSAANKSAKAQAAFEKEATGKLEALKELKLADLRSGNIFNEMGGFIFGNPNDKVMEGLRKSQADNAALASGDTSGFTKEVKAIINRSLAETFGGPKGSFENLSTKNLYMLKERGLANAIQTTNMFQNVGGSLYNFKFGILDQALDKEIQLKQGGQQEQAQYAQQAASQEGVGLAALGNTLSAAGQAYSGYKTNIAQQDALKFQQGYQTDYLAYLKARDSRPTPAFTDYIGGGGIGNSAGKSNTNLPSSMPNEYIFSKSQRPSALDKPLESYFNRTLYSDNPSIYGEPTSTGSVLPDVGLIPSQ